MIEREGDLFTTDQRAIGHGVNCQGVMGAGIAKSFRTFYPTNYGVYKGQCQVNGLTPGNVLIVPERDDSWDASGEPRLIVNLASQNMPGPDAQMSWLIKSVALAIKQLKSIGVDSMAIPQVGCGIGGLDWQTVKYRLAGMEQATDFTFEVWTYKE